MKIYRPPILGDRIEAMAGATVGALKNILVGHIEGEEVSGTIDDLIRHSVSKLSHIHFVSNEEAGQRLRQLGEDPKTIFVIGLPDIDVMLSGSLPSLAEVKDHYKINFESYGIILFHPVTTEVKDVKFHVRNFIQAAVESNENFLVLYPNNDSGSSEIFEGYKTLEKNPKFRILPSIRFEAFLSFLKGTKLILGNSSAGIREAPVYGIPTVNVGSRQQDRFHYESIINTV